MSNLSYQKRLAADLLKCGSGRVWVNPLRVSEVEDAVTRADVRILINAGVIRKKQDKGNSRRRINDRKKSIKKGRRRGHGSRKGSSYARYPRKRRWIDTIRPIRRRLEEMRDNDIIDKTTYRKVYRWSKGGMFKNVAHMEFYMKTNGLLDEKKLKKLR